MILQQKETNLQEENKKLKNRLYNSIKNIKEDNNAISHTYLMVYDLEQDLIQSVEFLGKTTKEHFKISLNGLHKVQLDLLSDLTDNITYYLLQIKHEINTNRFDKTDKILIRKSELLYQIDELLHRQINGVRAKKYSSKNNALMLNILLELKDIIAITARFMKLYSRHEIPSKTKQAVTIHSGR